MRLRPARGTRAARQPAKVAPDWADECDVSEASVSNKADAAAAVQQETCDRQDREAAFLERRQKRGRLGSDAADWRPSKRCRRSSLQWLGC